MCFCTLVSKPLLASAQTHQSTAFFGVVERAGRHGRGAHAHLVVPSVELGTAAHRPCLEEHVLDHRVKLVGIRLLHVAQLVGRDAPEKLLSSFLCEPKKKTVNIVILSKRGEPKSVLVFAVNSVLPGTL